MSNFTYLNSWAWNIYMANNMGKYRGRSPLNEFRVSWRYFIMQAGVLKRTRRFLTGIGSKIKWRRRPKNIREYGYYYLKFWISYQRHNAFCSKICIFHSFFQLRNNYCLNESTFFKYACVDIYIENLLLANIILYVKSLLMELEYVLIVFNMQFISDMKTRTGNSLDSPVTWNVAP